jgi:hypothetical protein
VYPISHVVFFSAWTLCGSKTQGCAEHCTSLSPEISVCEKAEKLRGELAKLFNGEE